MRRAAIGRSAWEPRPAKQWTAPELPGPRVPCPRVAPAPRPIVTLVKAEPTRDERYRRLVAALPCSNCGIEGYSQAAHGPTLGARIKADDRETFPLCADRPGVKGCHARFDQYELTDRWGREVLSQLWAERARALIKGKLK